VWKLDNMHTLFDIDRLGGMARMEGNPWRIAMKRFGRATAFVSSAIPTSYYNKVLGLGIPELGLIDQIAAFFIGSQAPTCRIDFLPGDLDERIADRLSAFGLRQVDFNAGFYGLPDVGGIESPPGVTIRDVDSDADLDTYLEIFHRGWEMDPSTLGAFKDTMRFWRSIPGWHLYLACLDGAPRGVGIMFARDGIGYLAVATTLHEYRKRGCEGALIRHAALHARELKCEFICGQCEVTSPTAHNFERIGMRLAYHKAIWLLRSRGASPAVYGEGDAPLY